MRLFLSIFICLTLISCEGGEGTGDLKTLSKADVKGSAAQQNQDPINSGEYQLLANWKKGDVRYARQLAERTTFVNEVEDSETILDFSYRFRVLRVAEECTIELFQENSKMPDLNPSYAKGSIEDYVQNVKWKGRELTNRFPFKLKIDRETGDVVDVVNRDEFIKVFTELGDSVYLDYFAGSDKSNSDRLKEVAQELCMQDAGNKINSVIISTNYLLQMYGVRCEIDGVRTEETVLNDENTSARFSGGEMPSTATITSSKTDDQLSLSINYSMIPSDFLDALGGGFGNIDKVGEDNMSLSQEQLIDYDMTTHWPNKLEAVFTMEVNVSGGNKTVKTIERTTTTFSKTPK